MKKMWVLHVILPKTAAIEGDGFSTKVPFKDWSKEPSQYLFETEEEANDALYELTGCSTMITVVNVVSKDFVVEDVNHAVQLLKRGLHAPL